MDRIDAFLRMAQVWLAEGGPSRHPTTDAQGSPQVGKYPHLAQGYSMTSAQTQQLDMQRATALLQEAIREWSHERQQHSRTKELLRLALLELRNGRHHDSFAAASASLTPNAQENNDVLSPRHESTTPRPAAQTGHSFRGSQHLDQLLFEAAPVHLHFESPLADKPHAVRTPDQLRSDLRVAHKKLSESSQKKAIRSHTPPFGAAVARFRDAVAVGGQIVYESSHSKALGVEYKTNTDVQRILAGEGPRLTSSALQARQAVEILQHRLANRRSEIPQAAASGWSPKRRAPGSAAGITTLRSP